jgi:hypothetical protein
LKLQKKSIAWAIKSLNKHHDTYIFPYPFEFLAINENLDDVINQISDIDICTAGIRAYRNALTPKRIFSFRIATQLDPIDSIITHSILYEICNEIEKARIPKSQNIVYSFRLNPQSDGRMYDPLYTWPSFLEKALDILNNKDYPFALITDISDFFPSIYLHDIEITLFEAMRVSGKSTHVQVFINYLKAMHLNQTHKGIPIGPQFSRPIAELILDSVDRQLIKANIKFIRFLDDYIAFFKSESEAYRALAFIAQTLYDTRNLKLNGQKTEILPKELFINRYLKKHKDIEKKSLIDSFYNLLDELGIDTNPYEDIDIDDLDENQKEKLKSINLEKILIDEISKDGKKIDYGLINFLLRNLAKIDNTNISNIILEEKNLRKLFPQLQSIISYLERVRSFSTIQKKEIGDKVISLLDCDYVGNLPFNQMWLLNLFSKSKEWDNEDKLNIILSKYKDNLTTRELYLSLGRSQNIRFFREKKFMDLNMDSWLRRAFIAGISCLPKSERNPWFKARSLINRDFLDQIVEKWVMTNPF